MNVRVAIAAGVPLADVPSIAIAAFGSTLGTVLQNSSIFATFRYQSGTAYTLCEVEAGNESVFSGGVCAEGGFEGGLNAARLPAFKDLSMVFRKGFSLGGVEATAYLDARNVLNLKNITSVFVATADIRNERERELNFAADSSRMIGMTSAPRVCSM